MMTREDLDGCFGSFPPLSLSQAVMFLASEAIEKMTLPSQGKWQLVKPEENYVFQKERWPQ